MLERWRSRPPRASRQALRGRFAPYVLGLVLVGLALLNLGFGLYASFLGEAAGGFWAALLVAGLSAPPLLWYGRKDAQPTRREGLIAVSLLWLVFPGVGAIPYLLSGGMSPVNAFFESASGYTATGATVLEGFASFPSSLFLYRAMSQWLGGVGIIVLFIAVLPQLAIAGRQLFFAEMTGPTDEKLTPRLRQTANAVLLVYLSLSALCVLGYLLAGMTPFEAVAHAFTTVSAAGFSTRAESFIAYPQTTEWVAIVFMVLAGISFALYIRAFSSRRTRFWQDPELRAYLAIILLVSLLVAWALRGVYEPLEALRHALFQVVSILTTTGYASADYDQWPTSAQALLVALMFVGGSAGSAAGGVKIVRWLIIGGNTARELRRTLHPRAVIPLRLGGVTIPDEVLRSVAAFVTLFVGLVALLVLALTALGADFTTAFTAAVACLGNVGPGLAGVGPLQSYAELHPLSRVLLGFAMIAGRLEILTVFVVLEPGFWRLPRNSASRV